MDYTYAELIRRNIDKHIMLLNLDWTEADDWRVGWSSIFEAGAGDEGTIVCTHTSMRYRAEVGWGEWLDSFIVATYMFENPDPIEVTVIDVKSGRIAYTTSSYPNHAKDEETTHEGR